MKDENTSVNPTQNPYKRGLVYEIFEACKKGTTRNRIDAMIEKAEVTPYRIYRELKGEEFKGMKWSYNEDDKGTIKVTLKVKSAKPAKVNKLAKEESEQADKREKKAKKAEKKADAETETKCKHCGDVGHDSADCKLKAEQVAIVKKEAARRAKKATPPETATATN